MRIRGKSNGLHESLLTTGDIALLAGVAPRTVAQWIDRGMMQGSYAVPSPGGRKSGDRRVPKWGVVAFFKQHGLPMPACFVSQMLLADVPEYVDLPNMPNATRVDSLFDLGLAVIPDAAEHVIVLDSGSFGRSETLSAGRQLRERLPQAVLIGIASEDEGRALEWAEWGYNHVLIRPFPASALAGLLKEGRA